MNLTIRALPEWHDNLARLLERLQRDPVSGRGRFIRDLAGREYDYWFHVPYYSPLTECFFLVLGDGSTVYWFRQVLYLTENRERLPIPITMKPEKIQEYEIRAEKSAEAAQEIRESWLLSYFAAWRGDKVGVEPLASDTDRLGITTKYVDLPINRSRDTTLTKEIVLANQDYVQHATPGEELRDDRVDIGIDVPTLNIDIHVVVDLDLYRDPQTREDAGLSYELRNRDFALLSTDQFGFDDCRIRWDFSRHPLATGLTPRPEAIEDREYINDCMDDLRRRLEQITDESTLASDGRPIVEDAERRKFLRSVHLPKQFLFGRFRWKMPMENLIVSITWNRPD